MYRYRGLLGLLLVVLAACADRRSEVVPSSAQVEPRMFHSANVLYDESDKSLKVYVQATDTFVYGPSVTLTPPSKYLFDGKEMGPMKQNAFRVFIPGAAYEYEEKTKGLAKSYNLTWVRVDKSKREFQIPSPTAVSLTVPEKTDFREGDRIPLRWQGAPLVRGELVAVSVVIRSRTNQDFSTSTTLEVESDTEFNLNDSLNQLALSKIEAPYRVEVTLVRKRLAGHRADPNFVAFTMYSAPRTTFTISRP